MNNAWVQQVMGDLINVAPGVALPGGMEDSRHGISTGVDGNAISQV